MPLILNIETSSDTCSVALSNDKEILGHIESSGINDHSANLTVFIEKIMAGSGLSLEKLDAVSVSKGPGSYTGLRIGVSVSKGICYGAQKPLIGIGTLEIMAAGALDHQDVSKIVTSNEGVLLCPMMDARRMEVYTALYDTRLNQVCGTKAELLSENTFKDYLCSHKIIFFGNGAEKFRNINPGENAVFVSGIKPSAVYMKKLSYSALMQKKFEDTAYFEPFYLKDFVATIPKKKI